MIASNLLLKMRLQSTVQPQKERSPEELKADLDLRPTMAFIHAHLREYREALAPFLAPTGGRKVRRDVDAFVKGVDINAKAPDIATAQLTPEQLQGVLYEFGQRAPEFLLRSRLKRLDFTYAGQVLGPVFNEDGTVQSARAYAPARWAVEDHPERVLVGLTHNRIVYPSFIPKETMPSGLRKGKSSELARAYAVAVFLHELVHTVLTPHREDGRALHFRHEGYTGNYDEWRKGFLADFHADTAPGKWPSQYARSYRLPDTVQRGDTVGLLALEELTAETAVRWFLGISPSPIDDKSNELVHVGFAETHPALHEHMNRLMRGTLPFPPSRRPLEFDGPFAALNGD